MIAPTYYRTLLTPGEQKCYKEIVTGLLARRVKILVRQSDAQADNIHKIVHAIHMDHPELFYVDFWCYKIQRNFLFGGSVTLEFRMLLDSSASVAVSNMMNDKWQVLQSRVQLYNSTREKYYFVAQDIISKTKYNNSGSAFWDHTAAGPVLRHCAVCEGISKLFLFLCQRLGLPCAIISGTLTGIPHAWNMVELDGILCYVDVTATLHSLSLDTRIPRTFFKTEKNLCKNGYIWKTIAEARN